MSTSPLSRMPELQAAVRALSGVGAATVRWPEPEGPATLRIELTGDADGEAVRAAVLHALQEVAGVDLTTLRVALPPPPGGEAGGDGASSDGTVSFTQVGAVPPPGPDEAAARPTARRPVFAGIDVRRNALDVTVAVALDWDGRRVVGEAEGLATRQSSPRVAAAAALSALREVVADDLRLQLEWLEIHDADHPGRPGIVQVAVAVLSRAGEEVVVGSALLRDDAREAAVRATLDALNRRLAHIGEGSAPDRHG